MTVKNLKLTSWNKNKNVLIIIKFLKNVWVI